MATTTVRPEPELSAELNPYHAALRQFHDAADRLGLEDRIRAILGACRRELVVNFPVEMDDGSCGLFQGYRLQHNVTRGPAKGRSEERRVGKEGRSRWS